MFERGKKDEPETGPGTTETARPAPTSTGNYGGAQSEMAVIGRSIRIDGDLRGEEDLRIEGRVTGTVKLASNSLTIGKEGEIHADVYAKSITVDGTLEGDLYGAERVVIRKNANVKGNITAPRVSLEEGARFRGSIEMDDQAVKAALGKPSATPKAQASSSVSATAKKEESAA